MAEQPDPQLDRFIAAIRSILRADGNDLIEIHTKEELLQWLPYLKSKKA